VQAVGFELLEPVPAHASHVAWGVLVTPWFMNLVRLPLWAAVDADQATAQGWARPRERVARVIGNHRVDCLGAEEPALGRFEACSLFSPMSPFADQAAAVATAREVLLQLRAQPVPADRPVAPARRSFLTGRAARAGAAP
jgi:[NiFe] hydrogenase assembly HybE family chaperone